MDQSSPKNTPKSSEKTRGNIKPFESPSKDGNLIQNTPFSRAFSKKGTMPSPVKSHNFEDGGSNLRKTVRIEHKKTSMGLYPKDQGGFSNAKTERRLNHKLSMLDRITEDMEKKVTSPKQAIMPSSKNEISLDDIKRTSIKLSQRDIEPQSASSLLQVLPPITANNIVIRPEIPKSNHLKLLIKSFYEGKRGNLVGEGGSSRSKPYSDKTGLESIVKESQIKRGGLSISNSNPSNTYSARKKASSRSFRDLEESNLLREKKLIKIVQVEKPDLFEKYFKGDLSKITLKLRKKQEEKKGLSTSLTSEIREYYLKPGGAAKV